MKQTKKGGVFMTIFIIVILLIAIFVGIYYYKNMNKKPVGIQTPAIQENRTNAPTLDFNNNPDAPANIKIASWNIQNFGQSKANNQEIMTDIAYQIKKYDIVAIQEVSNINEKIDYACERNVNAYNSENYNLIEKSLTTALNNASYKIVISPQVFDERYMYVYNSDKIKLENSYIYKDGNVGELCGLNNSNNGLMLREPFIGKFSIGKRNITLMNVHTSPTNNMNELNGLKIFYDELREKENVVLLGDFNFACDYYPDYDMFMNDVHIFSDISDSTVSTNTKCQYDQMFYKGTFVRSIIGHDVDKTINIKDSDHYPIWAELLIN